MKKIADHSLSVTLCEGVCIQIVEAWLLALYFEELENVRNIRDVRILDLAGKNICRTKIGISWYLTDVRKTRCWSVQMSE